METFLLISAIVVTLSALIVIYRLNNILARPLPTGTTISGGQAVHLMNIAGTWLTVTGGVATFPLIMMLIFTPSSGSEWVATLGVMGCLALLTAALLLIPVCIGQCLKRKVSVKRIALSAYHYIVKKGLKLTVYKTIGLIAGAVLLAMFLPYIADLLTLVAYAAGLLVAGRIGWLDTFEKGDENGSGASALTRSYNYATGEWDDVCQPGGMY